MREVGKFLGDATKISIKAFYSKDAYRPVEKKDTLSLATVQEK